MKRVILFAVAAVLASAAENDHPTGSRTTPPTVSSVVPRGIARGTTVELTVEGFNLARASAIYFSQPGVKGKVLHVKELPDLSDTRLGSNGTTSTVDLGPLPPRNQVTVEVEVSPDAEIAPVSFRLQTPLGTSPEGSFLVEPYYGESPDREPNDTPETAFETYLPTILVGAISRPGDVDYYKIEVKAGQQLVFENGGAMIGSTLQPVVSLLAADQSLVHQFGEDGGNSATYFAHTFDKAGVYYIRVADYQQSGRASHTYRIKVGDFPLAVATYPLGVQRGKTTAVQLSGYQLGSNRITVKGEPSPGEENAVVLRPEAPGGKSFYPVKLALGEDPEIESTGTNLTPSGAQEIQAPVTINGHIMASKAQKQYFRFHARKGEKLVLEVNARRMGSDLDSYLEVLDSKAKPIERATVRPVYETSITLNDRDSATLGIRLQSWTGIKVGDYVMVGAEVIRVESLPRGPDDDTKFESFGGQRLTFLDTTAEAHAVDQPIYKVLLYPPGAQFAPNGLPLARIYYQNDDGGPGYGKDSVLHFTAPADGDYLAGIRDVRGTTGAKAAYRLEVRHPRPDYRLSVTPRNPNVPLGSAVTLTVTAFRMDGFDGPIEVALKDLPAGLHASKGTIASGQVSTTLLLSADADATLSNALPLEVAGTARIGNRDVIHPANPGDSMKLIALMPKPDVLMTAETKVVELEAGSSADVVVSIQRQNGFAGRVPVDVRNLPPRVRVLNVGLNGVLINEDETRRSFKIEALPSAEPIEQLIYVGATVETRSNLPSTYSALQPVLVRVKPKPLVSSAK